MEMGESATCLLCMPRLPLGCRTSATSAAFCVYRVSAPLLILASRVRCSYDRLQAANVSSAIHADLLSLHRCVRVFGSKTSPAAIATALWAQYRDHSQPRRPQGAMSDKVVAPHTVVDTASLSFTRFRRCLAAGSPLNHVGFIGSMAIEFLCHLPASSPPPALFLPTSHAHVTVCVSSVGCTVLKQVRGSLYAVGAVAWLERFPSNHFLWLDTDETREMTARSLLYRLASFAGVHSANILRRVPPCKLRVCCAFLVASQNEMVTPHLPFSS